MLFLLYFFIERILLRSLFALKKARVGILYIYILIYSFQFSPRVKWCNPSFADSWPFALLQIKFCLPFVKFVVSERDCVVLKFFILVVRIPSLELVGEMIPV